MSSTNPRFIIAKLIDLIVSYDHKAETARIDLAQEQDLDLFSCYRRIDRSKNGFINKTDFVVFLNSYGVFLPPKAAERFFRKGRDGVSKITYKDFIYQLLPASEQALREECLAKSGETQGEIPQYNAKSVELKIASIYGKEADLAKEIQKLLNSCPKNFDIDDNLLYELQDDLTGYLDYKKYSIYFRILNTFRTHDFLEEHGFKLDQQKFEYLIRRICQTPISKISPIELLKYLFPEKFTKPKEAQPQEAHQFKFSQRPFTITQRPASATKFGNSPSPYGSKIGASSIVYGTQPKPTTGIANISSPIKPIDFPDLNNIEVREDMSEHDSVRKSLSRSSKNFQQPSEPKYSYSHEKEDRLTDRYSNQEIVYASEADRDSYKTAGFGKNTGQARPTQSLYSGEISHPAKEYIHYQPYDPGNIGLSSHENPQDQTFSGAGIQERVTHQTQSTSYRYSNDTQPKTIEHPTSNISNADLVSKLNSTIKPYSGDIYQRPIQTTSTTNLQNAYSTIKIVPVPDKEQLTRSYDYKQGFYPNKYGGNETENTNLSIRAPTTTLKYTSPLKETKLGMNYEYPPASNLLVSQKPYLQSLNRSPVPNQLGSYNPPERFYSPRYSGGGDTYSHHAGISQDVPNYLTSHGIQGSLLQQGYVGSNINTSYSHIMQNKNQPRVYITNNLESIHKSMAPDMNRTVTSINQQNTQYQGDSGQRGSINSTKEWKEKIEMSRKVKRDSYKFGNASYGNLWNENNQ